MRKSIFYLTILPTMAILTILIHCKKVNEPMVIDVGVDVHFKDKNNIDVFKDKASLADVDLTGNVLKVGDYPRGFLIYQRDNAGGTVLRVFPDPSQAEKPTIYLKIGNISNDTLQLEMNRNKGSVVCTKVFVNGKLVWPVSNVPADRLINISVD